MGIGLVLGLAALALLPAAASAATITVGPTDDAADGGFDDTGCTLRDAIKAANTNAPTFDCPGDNGGGTGVDVILLQGGQTYKLTQHNTPEDTNVSGDLDITGGGGTIIRSTGSGLATIDADSNTIPGPPDAQRGRAIDIRPGAGAVTFEGLRIQGGTVTDGGGGGIRTFAPLTLTGSEVRDNLVGLGGGGGGGGGGIYVLDPGGLTLTGSTVADNLVRANPAGSLGDQARGGGITYVSFSGDLNATNSTISGNVVDAQGLTINQTYAGGIYFLGFGRTMNLTNVTVSNNSAIGGNSPAVYGGGVVLFEHPVTFTNVILAGNHAPANEDCGQVNSDDDWTSGGNNVIGDSSGCGHIGGSNDVFFATPNLGMLSNYGGLTRTMLPNPGSPAINRGGTCPTTDQRGLFRTPAAPCDTGSVEVGATVTPPATPATGPTGQRDAALKKCKKKRSKKARKKCRRKAALLPI